MKNNENVIGDEIIEVEVKKSSLERLGDKNLSNSNMKGARLPEKLQNRISGFVHSYNTSRMEYSQIQNLLNDSEVQSK